MEDLWDFVVTGTAAYGPQTPGKSDIDIVLTAEKVETLLDELHAVGIAYQFVTADLKGAYPGASFYFTIGGLKFNIIAAYDESAFRLWREKTERMKKLSPIADRAERLRIFNLEEGELP